MISFASVSRTGPQSSIAAAVGWMELSTYDINVSRLNVRYLSPSTNTWLRSKNCKKLVFRGNKDYELT
uniref:Secreted protein n=1 Tax=Caenorhabditis tropicalis TaxID=1561998 RepID=A0A1I7UKA8_9PELO